MDKLSVFRNERMLSVSVNCVSGRKSFHVKKAGRVIIEQQGEIIMEILVCIKQVPDDSVEISLNEATDGRTFKRSSGRRSNGCIHWR